jgi:hypothetical protein
MSNTKKADIRYPLELFIKYRNVNNYVPDQLKIFIKEDVDDNIIHHSCLQLPEIRAYLNSHMSRKNMNGEDENLYSQVQALLNKLSNTNFNDIACDIKDLPYIKKKHVYKLCETIILKSINEPSYSDTYAKLSNSLLTYYIVENKIVAGKKVDEKIFFKVCLMTICQDVFEQITNNRTVGKAFEYDRSTDYSKLKFSGLMKCLGEFYNNDVISEKIIIQCFSILYSSILKGEEYYDPFNTFILCIIKKLKSSNNTMYKKLRDSIDGLVQADKIGEATYDEVTYQFKFNKSSNKFKIFDILDAFKLLDNK